MGTRSFLLPYLENKGDHPHACGDKISAMICVAVLIGSSPRVWGQVFTTAIWDLEEGIIPTRMGTSDGISGYDEYNTDHPHAYGDKKENKRICE